MGAVAVALAVWITVPSGASAAAIAAACPNPGVFSGTDTNGQFQAALDNAIAAAQACVPCCDRIVSYRVVNTTGRVGGIAGLDEITVQIVASY
ncbi:MAG TPA: hypothetical protein VJS92_16990 [Candidatus Polarisedimenticolaceae bacterium]|nr:hypothetical protein [Candidatus Polarisedimenticolaceae bacterium]